MIPDNYPYKVGYSWAPPYRFQRITQVLQQAHSASNLDVAAMQRLQSDVHSLPAVQLIALLRAATTQQESTDATKMLLSWNGNVDRDSAAAALYEVWLRIVTRETMKLAIPPAAQVDDGRLVSASGAFVPSGHAAGCERRNETPFLVNPWTEAWQKMEELQGPDPAKWSWGEMHHVRFRHPLDQIPGAAALTDPTPVPRPGDEYTVNATGYPDNSFDQTSGASYREILDLSDWDHSVAVNVPGQSGQPGSPHYSDLLPLWSEGKYFPLVYSRDAVEKETTDMDAIASVRN